MHRRVAALLFALLLALPAVTPATAAEPDGAAIGPSVTPDGVADPTGRFIVLLRKDADTNAVADKADKRDGVKADRKFKKAFRGFAAKLDPKQKRELLADPNVVALVPDGVVHLTAQTVPTGISRVFGLDSPIADIDGVDTRVDADVAITDTGLSAHPDLNVAGGYNCSSSNRTAWGDNNNHGTHVAGTIGALDNGIGVVGVAPGARVWGVKILNSQGDGLISWYLCGLDWILAQRDPTDPSRPLFEAVNMSVTKDGSDDHNCGFTNGDLLHQAICRVVAGGITVVAAAANDSHSATRNIPASYDEAITVSALADTDGLPGGFGGNKCISFGGYDKDDTFADFSNYGMDVDIMAPGKCILSTIPGGYASMSGTSMATPTVVGAVALYKESRPNATPAEVREALRYLGNLNWNTATDPDSTHEPLLDVSRIGPLGTFALTPGGGPIKTAEAGTNIIVPFGVARSETFFEAVTSSITSLPAGWTGTGLVGPYGWSANGVVSVTPPPGTDPGTYQIGVRGTNQGRSDTTTVSVKVVADDDPTASPPTTAFITDSQMGTSTAPIRVSWPAATDPTSAIAGYQLQRSVNDGPWGTTTSLSASTLSTTLTLTLDAVYRFRVRAMDAAGHWSPWAEAGTSRFHPYDDRSATLVRTGSWKSLSSSTGFKKTLSSGSSASASLSLTFTGHSIGVLATKSLYRGKANVYIDGALFATVSMKSTTSTARRFVFSRSIPAGGTHTIKVVPTGTGTYKVIRIDAIVVGR